MYVGFIIPRRELFCKSIKFMQIMVEVGQIEKNIFFKNIIRDFLNKLSRQYLKP